MGRNKGGHPDNPQEELLEFDLRDLFQEPLTQGELQRNEADTEFLEMNEEGLLVTEAELQERRERRERLAAVQPPENLQAAEAAQEAAPVRQRAQQQAQHCSWKDRYIRQKGAQQLREMANAQVTGEALRVRSRRERLRQPLEIDQMAHTAARQYGRVIAYQEGKQQREQSRADTEMEHNSQALRANMLRDTRKRQGGKSGREQLEELERMKGLSAVDRLAGDLEKMIRGLSVCGGGAVEAQILRVEGKKMAAEARELDRIYRELIFRRHFVLPVCQSRGLRRLDLVDSVRRMEEGLLAQVPEAREKTDKFLERARDYILAWNAQNPGAVPAETIREYLPGYKEEAAGGKEEETPDGAGESEEIVDIEDVEEKKKELEEPDERFEDIEELDETSEEGK